MERIQAKYAEGIFIIADRNSPFSSQEEDRHNTLSTLAFRNVSDAGIYTYNLLPESEIYQKMAATQVVCADELRQVLLAFNCMQQASATLILNLLHQHRPSEKFEEAWEAEYDDSLGNEFYISYLNPIFDGKPFSFVSWVSKHSGGRRYGACKLIFDPFRENTNDSMFIWHDSSCTGDSR